MSAAEMPLGGRAGGDLRVALLGNPNTGKTALFNLLTGSRQKVANYAGVTVERKEGAFVSPSGRRYRVLDLPGAYSLGTNAAAEGVTRDVLMGVLHGEDRPDVVVCVTDSTKLRLNLRLVMEVKKLGLPVVVALNMTDVAEKKGFAIDVEKLSRALGVPIIKTVAIKADGAAGLVRYLDNAIGPLVGAGAGAGKWKASTAADVAATQRDLRRIVEDAIREPAGHDRTDAAIDRVVMHPLAGLAILAAVLFMMFQAVFSWAALPMDMISGGIDSLGAALAATLPDGALRSLIVDGIIAGVGSVLVFIPQIVILFFFILVLEDSGYLPRAAFLLDRFMGVAGLSGRSFIPLLSSFACAIPGIMATRTIGNWRDRLTTIMIAPLMTCSARLPVYALLIGAFIPVRDVGPFNLQGIVLFTLYMAGILSAMGVAFVAKRIGASGKHHALMLELPAYRWPNPRNLLLGLWERALVFLRRAGTIILSLMVVLWFLSSYPGAPEGATAPAITYSFAGMIGRGLEVIFAPIGFNWQISIALVPGLAAREVAVGALGTVYALSAAGDDVGQALTPMIAGTWSFATALSLLVWYVFAPQCLATLAVVKRETNAWRYPLFMAFYLFALAYAASFVTYRVALWLGAG